ncbi:MAG: hypothetical protein ACD_39C00972G0002 [uncultured bacterium]|nr:MAG: hypothetical protein ACD_39C00972G0002 [uncultured bacterium]
MSLVVERHRIALNGGTDMIHTGGCKSRHYSGIFYAVCRYFNLFFEFSFSVYRYRDATSPDALRMIRQRNFERNLPAGHDYRGFCF